MPDLPDTVGALFRHARAALEAAGKPDAAVEARLIVEHATGASRTAIVTEPERAVAGEAAGTALSMLRRRLAGEPIYRIIGSREFHGLELKLSPGTLEPRSDTEALVDLALPLVRAAADRFGVCRILDLGTGTGAIALALLHEEPRALAVGCDISDDALATASLNADITGNTARFEAVRSDWFGSVEGRFHVIVSNPPYIRSQAVEELTREVREHDPRVALDGGPDGLTPYRVIASGAADFLEEDGSVAVEIGYDQAEAVTDIFMAAGFIRVTSMPDLAGHMRALSFRL